MAPTTMPNQRATTCPYGRDVTTAGYPIRVVEVISSLVTPAYVARVNVSTPLGIPKAKQAVRKAFQYQKDKVCFSLVEFVSTCPTNWGMSPIKACDWANSDMIPYYPLGEFKTPEDPLQAKFKSGEWKSDVKLGLKMLLKGKLKVLPPKCSGVKEVQSIFKRAEEHKTV